MHNLVALGEAVDISYEFVQTLKSLVSNRLGTSGNTPLYKRWTTFVADVEGNWHEGAPDIVRFSDLKVVRSGDDSEDSGDEQGEEELRSENDEEASESEVEVVGETPASGSKARKTGARRTRSSRRDAKGKAKAVKEEGTPRAKKAKGEPIVFDEEKDTPWLRNVRSVFIPFQARLLSAS